MSQIFNQDLVLNAESVYVNLLKAFPGSVPYIPRYSQYLSSPLSIGIEIEIPWRAYFPELWKKYFQSGAKKYYQMTAKEQTEVTACCAMQEVTLLPLLKKSESAGVKRGNDRYWEFALPPSHDIGLITKIVGVLEQHGLCPFTGPYSLHITIGGLKPSKSVYRALMALEILFTDARRVQEGMDNFAWAKKGRAGVFHKQKDDLLFGADHAVELKVLHLPSSLDAFHEMFIAVSVLASWLAKEIKGEEVKQWGELKARLGLLLVEYNLPDILWQNPKFDPEVWGAFSQALPKMRDVIQTMFPRL